MNTYIAALTSVTALALLSASPLRAHQLTVFASTDCKVVTVEARFSSGRVPVAGEVRVLDGKNRLLLTRKIGKDGTLAIPLEEVDAATGLLIEVDTGSHENYWILTPEDTARTCQS